MAYIGHIAPHAGRLSWQGLAGVTPEASLPTSLSYENIQGEFDASSAIWWARMAPQCAGYYGK